MPHNTSTGASQEAHEYYWRLVRASERAAKAGDVVLAAIQRQRAARVAPTALGYVTRQEAITGLLGLVERLQKPLKLSPAEMEEWRKHLPTLLDKADQGSRPVEAALLYDLQQVCLDHEREIYALDLMEWIQSGGKRPIKRPLPSQRLVRVTRSLRSAAQRLPMARLGDEDREQFAGLLQEGVRRSEESVRDQLRPRLTHALEDVGLKPRHPLEATAFHKVVEELLDRIIASGFVTFSELRDTLSRSSLKLPDLDDPHDFIRGDPLLRLDRLLAGRLDGVYVRGEFYLRLLERFTALNFGTPWGRLLTMFVTIPFLGAFLLLEAPAVIAQVFSFFSSAKETPEAPAETGETVYVVDYHQVAAITVVGFFLMGLLHSAQFRRLCLRGATAVGRPLRKFLVDGPIWLLSHPSLKDVTASWPFQLFYWYMLKPLFLTTLVVLAFMPLLPANDRPALVACLIFLAAMFFVNSRPGHAAEEAVFHVMTSLAEQLRAGLLPGMVAFVARLFKQILHLGDALMFNVEEWLRLRSEDQGVVMVARTLLSFLWFPVAYLIRFNVVVLIEPTLNPLKFPIVTIATKLMLPLIPVISETVTSTCTPILGPVLAKMVGWWIAFWSPDIPTFIIWEMKENWSLYRANRRSGLQPVMLGKHGETMRGLLVPGFHSGRIPKVFARLREAERVAPRVGSWSNVRACRSALTEVEDAIKLFVTREFCDLLGKASGWSGPQPTVGRVGLATNQVRVEITHPEHADLPMALEFENRAGTLLASLTRPGWLENLPADQQVHVQNALVILWNLAGVDRVQQGPEQKQLVHITWDECVQCCQPNLPVTPPRSLAKGLDLFADHLNGSNGNGNGALNHMAFCRNCQVSVSHRLAFQAGGTRCPTCGELLEESKPHEP